MNLIAIARPQPKVMPDRVLSSTSRRDTERLAALAKLDLAGVHQDQEFADIVVVTRRMFDCPIATVTIVAAERQWFAPEAGQNTSGRSRRDSIWA